jgi:ribokinase
VVGNDTAGEEILAELKKEEVEPIFQKHSDDHTAYSSILVHHNAERTILSYKGEGQHFDVNKIPFDKLKAKWFYINSLGGHYDLFEALVDHAVKNGIKIACNPGGRELEYGFAKLELLLKHVDIFAVNKEEGASLVGTESVNQNETLVRLQRAIKGVVVLTDGHNGVKVRVNGSEQFHNGARREYSAEVPSSPIVERTGAGDAFNSGFVAEYIRQISDLSASSGQVIVKAIQFGTANASSVVTKFGAKAGILKKGDWGPWPLVEVRESQV